MLMISRRSRLELVAFVFALILAASPLSAFAACGAAPGTTTYGLQLLSTGSKLTHFSGLGSPVAGEVIYDTTNNALSVCDGNSWTSGTASSSTYLRGDNTWATPAGGGLTVGASTITSGTTTRVLYDNAGVLGEYTITGTGNVVMSASPTLTGTISAAIANFSGALTDTQAIGATSTDGLLLANTTAATSGNQKWSPRLHFSGRGWKTNSTAASQAVDMIEELQPVQGTSNPSGKLVWSSSINGGGYTSLMTLNTNGNVGIGTASPQNLLHVATGATGYAETQYTNAATSHTVADGFFVGLDVNEQNGFVWNSEYGAIEFGTDDVTRMTITSDGAVTVGEEQSLQLVGDWPAIGFNYNLEDDTYIWADEAATIYYDFTNNGLAFTAFPGGAAGGDATGGVWNAMFIQGSNGFVGIGEYAPAYRLELPNTASTSGRGRANQWATYSDGRFKKDVKPIEHALDKVAAMQGITYTSSTEKDGERQIGFIAQDVEKVVPEVVSVSDTKVKLLDGSIKDVPDYRSMAYDRLTPVLVEAIKELKTANDNQEKEIQILKKALERR